MSDNETSIDANTRAESAWRRRLRFVAPFAALILATLIVYWPSFAGGFVWDDDAHVTNEELRSVDGLRRIWLEPGATQQYYPLLFSAFWLQFKLWGANPLGYHVVNVLLHACAAVMVFLVLRKLTVPGAFLAAMIFALHPVNVESVAWISEQKNTLSAVLYLGAMACYFWFDEDRKRAWYFVALILFVLALLSKASTVTLPAALLVIFWWRRGKLSWKRDVAPLIPWFVMSVGIGLFIAWFERRLIGAQGEDHALSLAQRFLLAGRAVWFYASKVLWPVDLTFIYPRWNLDPADWRQWLFPLTAVAVVVGLWLIRRRTRAPLAAVLFYIGTLFPVLGLFNVFYFLYSFVADHFQYLAMPGIITLVAAGVAQLLAHSQGKLRLIGQSLCALLLIVLAVLTGRQCFMYRDKVTLYTTTIKRNPECWMAYNNLSKVHFAAGRYEEAIRCCEETIRIHGVDPEAHFNLGYVLAAIGRNDEALANYETALRQQPTMVAAHYCLGNLLVDLGELDRAVACFESAIRLDPKAALNYYGLGNARLRRDEVRLAIGAYEAALRLNPLLGEAHNNLGAALLLADDLPGATAHFRESARIRPSNAEAQGNLGDALLRNGNYAEAVTCLREALRLKPEFVTAMFNLSKAQSALGDRAAAISTGADALALARSQGNGNLVRLIEIHLATLRSDGLEFDN